MAAAPGPIAIHIVEAPCLPWWAEYTRHQHEKVAAGMLSAKGFEVYLPLYASARRWKDRRQLLEIPLFPGYAFVRGGRRRRLQVVMTPGVHRILRDGERAAIVREDEIDAIRHAVEGRLRVEPHPYLNAGKHVRGKHGALRGIEGILDRQKNQWRLVLSVEVLAQSVCGRRCSGRKAGGLETGFLRRATFV